jgi:hypothetical protein
MAVRVLGRKKTFGRSLFRGLREAAAASLWNQQPHKTP